MKVNKIVLMIVAVVAVGIFVLPSTVSLFSGQHTWYDLSISGGGNDVPCEKCHVGIGEEMQSGGDNGAHEGLTCSVCHRSASTGIIYARGSYGSGSGPGPGGYQSATPGEGAHAASTVECMDCHGAYDPKPTKRQHDPEYVGNCNNCHHGPKEAGCLAAGGFGLTPWKSTWDTGNKSAHLKFVLDTIDEPLKDGANEACIACHTRIAVDIKWTKKEDLNFHASEDGYGVWTISDLQASGENVKQVNTSNGWTNP